MTTRSEQVDSLRAVWAVVRESAMRRLGLGLLKAYLLLLVVGALIVVGSVVWAVLG